MKAPRRLESDRLVLLQPRAEDAAAIFERYASDPEVTRFLNWPRHRSIADTDRFIEFSANEWARWPAGPYLVWSRHGRRLIGSTGLHFEAPDRAMTGYVLARDAWGCGYATETLEIMIDVARQTGVVELFASCHAEHRPSWRVLEKCGFTRDDGRRDRAEFPNLAPGVLQDVERFAILLAP